MNKETLIEEFRPLIKSIASNFYDVDYNDLFQAGVVGLMYAYNNYKKDSITKFSSYAYKYIFGEMYKYTLSAKALKQNRDMLKIVKLVEKTSTYLTQTMGKVPSIDDIAKYLEMDSNLINLAISSTFTILSLDKEIEEDTTLYNAIKDNSNNYQEYMDLNWSIENLEEPYKSIIKLRYFDDYTQTEVAKKLKLTQVKVSRYEKKSLEKLYEYLN